MPPCEMANACTQPHKTMYTHLAATRMYTYRMLWMDMILPEPDRDSGSVRTLVILKISPYLPISPRISRRCGRW